MNGHIDASVIISSTITGVAPVIATLDVPVTILTLALGYHGQSGSLDKSITITSHFVSNAYSPTEIYYPRQAFIQKNITVNANMLGGITDAITGNVVISSDMEGYSIFPMFVEINATLYGQTGDFIRTGEFGVMFYGLIVNISAHATGVAGNVYTGNISSPVVITGSASGRLDPIGQINGQVVVSSQIDGESTTINSLFANIQIGISAFGLSVINEGSIDKQITITPHISCFTNYISGTIDASVPLTINVQGKAPNVGSISAVVPIAAKQATNRARSYLPNGDPVPLSFRHGIIETSLPITCNALQGGAAIVYGIGQAEIVISTDINTTRGRVDGRAGNISSQVIIEASLFDTLYGEAVAKLENSAVVSTINEGVNVAKIGTHAVTGLVSDSIAIGKAVAYAVIAPSQTTSTDSTYQAIIFF